MIKSVPSRFFQWIFSALVLAFLLLILFQLDSIEARLIQLEKRQKTVIRMHTSQDLPFPKKQEEAGLKSWLHPDLPDFLDAPVPTQNKNALYDGMLHKVYSFQGVDPKGMNFILESSAGVSEDIREYVSLSLAARSKEFPGKYYGELARRIEILDDFQEFVIYLRPGVYWHRPALDFTNRRYGWLDRSHPVTARDIKTTLDYILDPQVQAAHLRNYYQDIESVQVLDELTLKIRWKKKTYQAVSFTMGLWPTPGWLYRYDEDGNEYQDALVGLKFNQHWYNNKAIGCGPYMFAGWDPGVMIRLIRNEEYFGEKPPIKELWYHLIRDKNQQLLNFQSGVLDLHTLPVSQYREEILEGKDTSPYKDGTYPVHRFSRFLYRYIGWNLQDWRFSDVRVRRAMTHAMDREGIVKNVLHGLGRVVTGPFHPDSLAYDSEVLPLAFDLQKARELLLEAGFLDRDGDGILEKEVDGKLQKFEFSLLMYAHRPEVRSFVAIFKENLYKIGVLCHLVPVEWSVMLKRMEDRDFLAYTGGWGLDIDGDPYQIWHSSQADLPRSSNLISFKDPKADALIEALRETFIPEQREKLQREFHRRIHELQPYTFLYTEDEIVCMQKRVKNVSFQNFRPHVQTLFWYIAP